MYYPLHLLQVGNIKTGGIGSAIRNSPRASRIDGGAAQGIVSGDMAWPLVVAGGLFGVFYHDSE